MDYFDVEFLLLFSDLKMEKTWFEKGSKNIYLHKRNIYIDETRLTKSMCSSKIFTVLFEIDEVILMSPYSGRAKYFLSALFVSTGIDHCIFPPGKSSGKNDD